ncbi:LysR family transcriptional regulator [Streptomyces rimosus]|uniref:LysR family transcriptional regulator n=1 Tax=Streptomyces rimosus TaxID=1927 RepID=UPI0004C12ADE|nr:LysR substrate-binding domain-containing protein [Streptomyces rimosus]
MDLTALRTFRMVARHEHISRAAAELRVAQPAVSRTVARLEAELGVPLFDRQGRSIRLNRYGAAFLRRVERALGELDDARRELADAAGLDQGRVVVAAETLLTLTSLLSAFRAAHPGVEIRLHQSTAEVMARQLADREVDLCIASQPLSGAGLRSVVLREEDVLLAVPVGHRLAGRERVGLDEVADEPFVTTRRGHWQRELLDRLFAAAGRSPVITCEGDEPAATQFMIGAGLGVGLIPEIARNESAEAPVRWLRLDVPGCRRTLCLVRRADTYVSVAERRFEAAAVAHFGGRAGSRALTE